MIRIITLVFFILFVFKTEAQFFEGFEENCTDYTKPFLTEFNCYPDWVNTNGSPDTQGFFEAGTLVEAVEGERYVHMYVAQDGDCTSFSQKPFGDRGEGIALNYPFQKNQEYTIRYYDRFSSGGSFYGEWILTDGLSENYFPVTFGPKCSSGGDHVPDIPPSHQIANSFSWGPINSWTLREFTFTADSDYSMLWLRLDNGYTNANLDKISHMLLDAFEIVCGHENEAPEFSFVDEDGNPKSQFCYGEDVWIDVEVNDYSKIWLGAMDWPNNPGWLHGYSNEGKLNVSKIYRDFGLPVFLPNQLYNLTIAVDYPDCGWVERSMKFEYVCCGIDADFSLQINEFNSGVIEGNSIVDYGTYGGSHSFCLYIESPQGTLIQVTCSNTSNFTFAPYDEDVRYHLVHEVTTLCGTDCVSYDFCVADAGCSPSTILDACDYLNSCIFLEVEDLGCPERKESNNPQDFDIRWAPVPDAISYQVVVVYEDGDCGCPGDKGPYGVIYGSTINETTIQGTLSSTKRDACFSYKVRARCDGGYGPWSDKICYPDCSSDDDMIDDDEFATNKRSSSNDLFLSAYPNPFTGEIRVSLSVELEQDATLELRDLMGRLISKSIVDEQNETISTDAVSPGVYILILQLDNGVRLTKKLFKS